MPKLVAACVLIAMILMGCNGVDLNDPAQAISNAERVGNLAVFAYFATNKADVKNAAKYKCVLTAIESNITKEPAAGGFISLVDVIHAKLAVELTGDDAAFLPGAKSLTRILLMELDARVKLPKVEVSDKPKLLLDIVKAFVLGAKTSLGDFIPST